MHHPQFGTLLNVIDVAKTRVKPQTPEYIKLQNIETILTNKGASDKSILKGNILEVNIDDVDNKVKATVAKNSSVSQKNEASILKGLCKAEEKIMSTDLTLEQGLYIMWSNVNAAEVTAIRQMFDEFPVGYSQALQTVNSFHFAITLKSHYAVYLLLEKFSLHPADVYSQAKLNLQQCLNRSKPHNHYSFHSKNNQKTRAEPPKETKQNFTRKEKKAVNLPL